MLRGSRSASPTPRVLVVGPLPDPTHGASLVTAMIVDDLTAAGIDCHVIDTSASSAQGRVVYNGLRLARHLRAAMSVIFGRYSSAYVGGAGGAGLWYQLLVVAACRVRGVHSVFHHHSSAYLTRRRSVMALICRVNRTRCTHIALTSSMAQSLRTRYRAANVITISNAAVVRHWFDKFPDEHRADATDASSSIVTLGHLSNLSVEKGLADVYATYELLRAAQPGRFRLVIAGATASESDATVMEQAKQRLPEVTHVGRLDRAGVTRFFDELDVFLFPSRYADEAEPLVVLEALSSAVPVVSIASGFVKSVSYPPEWCLDAASPFAVEASSMLTSVTNSQLEQIGERGMQSFGELAHEARARLTRLYATL